MTEIQGLWSFHFIHKKILQCSALIQTEILIIDIYRHSQRQMDTYRNRHEHRGLPLTLHLWALAGYFVVVRTYFCMVPCTIYVMTSRDFYHSACFVNWHILAFASHNQLHIYGFSDKVNLLSSSPGTELHLLCGALVYESCETRHELRAQRLVEAS